MGWIFSEMYIGTARLDGKTVVITGCDTGIGKEVAREFYKRGARVVMACVNMQNAMEALDEIKESVENLGRPKSSIGELVLKEIDLASFESVRKCAAEILESEPAIHLLVNNAGIALLPKGLSKDGYEQHFAVNHLGHFLFTLLLLPRIIKSSPARIIVVSSVAYRFYSPNLYLDDINLNEAGYSRMFAYSRSKLANLLFAKELGKRLKDTGVTTYSVNPGDTYTGMYRRILEMFPLPVTVILKIIARSFIKTPVQGAQTILYCSIDPECADETGLYYAECAKQTPKLGINSEEMAIQLWEASIKLVKLENFDSFISG